MKQLAKHMLRAAMVSVLLAAVMPAALAATGALNWAQVNGILKDVPFTNATENATRAQTAQILMNFLTK